MQLEPLYRVTFTTPEAWNVTREGGNGTEGRSFLIAEVALMAWEPISGRPRPSPR
jgi:hypothetical protein